MPNVIALFKSERVGAGIFASTSADADSKSKPVGEPSA